MPNARVLPVDDLALAHERMREATVEQLRTALVMHARGEDIGVFVQYVKPFLVLAA